MQFVQRYFGSLLIVSCLLGMVVPSIGDSTPVVVMIALACIIFCSYFRITFSGSMILKDTKLSFTFWILRYITLPVTAYFIMKPFSGFYAQVLLLTLALPAAVSSPAFCAIYGGKPDLSLKILIYSSFLSVVTIPFLMTVFSGSVVRLEPIRMLMTLVYTIVIPFLIYLPLRKSPIAKPILHYNSVLTLMGLSIIFVFVTARNKQLILGNLNQVGLFALIAGVVYAVMYISGYFLLPKQDPHARRTFAISSGANNIGLGVTITALFFPGQMNIFFIISQLMWVVMLVPLRRAFKRGI